MTEFTRLFLTHFWQGYDRENQLDDWWKGTYHDFLQLRQIVIYIWMNKKWDMDNLHESQRSGLAQRRYEIENDVRLIDLDFTQIDA